MKAGLVSITFRALPWERVLDLAAACGLEGVEWGGDVHVPCGDLTRARQVGCATRARGLQTACYGSYCRLMEEDSSDGQLAALVETARTLGAPMIRVWAGRLGSALTTEAQRAGIVRNAQRLAAIAESAGLEVVFEFHGGTLTDDAVSARRLLEAIDRKNVGCLWQPPVGMNAENCRMSIRMVAEYVRNVHVFSWSGEPVERFALAAGAAKWSACLEEIERLPGDRWLLLEFVRGDAPEQLAEDASTLKRWMRGAWNE